MLWPILALATIWAALGCAFQAGKLSQTDTRPSGVWLAVAGVLSLIAIVL